MDLPLNLIEDNGEYKDSVERLLTKSKAVVNLKNYFSPQSDFYKQWRWRIKELKVLLLDQADQVVPNLVDSGVTLAVTFPALFNDTDDNKVVQPFLSGQFYCRSTYTMNGKPYDSLIEY